MNDLGAASTERTGRCTCGATRYRVSGEPLSVHACHCTDCQALSGSAFGLSMVLNREQLDVTAGETQVDRFKTDHNEMLRHHCANCGTALWFSSPEYPDWIAIKPGTLDDTSTLQPIAHLWVRSKQPWLELADGLPQFDEQPAFDALLDLARRKPRN